MNNLNNSINLAPGPRILIKSSGLRSYCKHR